MLFRNRYDAGRRLGARLAQYRKAPNLVVLGLPRGGVPVASEVAKALGAPLDVFLVRKLGVPGREELAMGAVANGTVLALNDAVVRQLAIPDEVVQSVARVERYELQQRDARYRRDRPALPLRNCTVILIDDGLATGSTMRAAVEAVRRHEPRSIIVAVPVGAADTCAELSDLADDVVCAARPARFHSVGAWYADFTQTSDEEVEALLDEAAERRTASRPGRLLMQK
jgi:putative phosphoribosyl transferase